MSDDQPNYLLIGEVLRPHGVAGELRVRILTDYPERIAAMDHIYLGTGPTSRKIKQHKLEGMRMHKGYALLKLARITDRNLADRLRGLYVMVPIEDAIPLEDDEIYLYQLIGMRVQTTEGVDLGKISDVLETGANDVYIVNGGRYGEVLIPVTDETIIETDDVERVITVQLPDGLLPTN